MGPTIDVLLSLYGKHPLWQAPAEPPSALRSGWRLRRRGEEAAALGFYERAMVAGLAGDIRRRCYLQYGSTLRDGRQRRRNTNAAGTPTRAQKGSAWGLGC
jgi:hypothetical protein